MSIDKSLISRNKLIRERNVYSKDERIAILKKDGRWKDDESVFGLKKVKVLHRLKHKVKKEKEAPKAEAVAAQKAEPSGKTEKTSK